MPVGPLAQQLAGEVSVDGAWVHLQALQRIADENGGNRAAGTPGYEASVEYVAGVLAPRVRGEHPDLRGVRRRRCRHRPQRDRRDREPRRRRDDRRPPGLRPEGPGIVDNGSGVASLLEIDRLGADPEVQNTVRFVLRRRGERRRGLDRLRREPPRRDLEKIKLYLNVDMVASPNGGYFAQGGEGRDEEGAGPAGSATIGRVLAEQLTAAGVTAPEIVEFVGDDESPFIEAGIPVGGAENGDAKEKTAQQARAWGGQAGEVYDPCYHQACDRLDNVNRDVLDHYLRAVAGTLARFATSTVPLR